MFAHKGDHLRQVKEKEMAILCLVQVDPATQEATGTVAPFCSETCRHEAKSSFDYPDHTEGVSDVANFGFVPCCEKCGGEITGSDDTFDGEQATREGWDLFDVEGRIQLQRIDEPEDAINPHFPSDADALVFVALQAYNGSKYHRDALERIGSKATAK